MSKKNVLLICLQLVMTVSYAQGTFGFGTEEIPNPKKDIKTGDKYFSELNYKQALYFYLRANKSDSNNAVLQFSIGECYLNSLYKTRALPYLERAIMLDPHVNKDIDFLIGQAYQYNLLWEEAMVSYQRYYGTWSANTLKRTKAEIDKKIEECESGLELTKKPKKVKIENLGPNVNSSFDEYAPMISANDSIIFFTSRRPFKQKDFTSSVGYENIFYSIKKDGQWERAQQLEETVNFKNLNNSNIAISFDAKKMMVYNEGGNGDFYESISLGSKWSEPKKIEGAINSGYRESSASISYDGKTIYFVSERPGGMGGGDIYKCTINENGKFGIPENLGPGVNTPYDEEGVSIHPDGKTLYFNSEGHNSMGGYDIFKTVYENGEWSKPENLGYPINTPDNDMYFFITSNGKTAYYSSIKEGGYGETDIYQITLSLEK